jgi:hypothetical protein
LVDGNANDDIRWSVEGEKDIDSNPIYTVDNAVIAVDRRSRPCEIGFIERN